MLTRRGWAVAGVAVGGFVMAAWFSARSLNAVVAPAVVALVAGWVQRKRADQPELHTEPPGYGFAGESVTFPLDFVGGTPQVAAVELSAGEGLAVETEPVETTVTEGTIPFEVRLGSRGVRSVGPVEVAAEDVLGLWRTVYEYPVRREVVVFPKIRRLTDAGDLASFHRALGVAGRDRFEGLREYERGDPLRDVHWTSSAKRPDDLVVVEFAAREDRQRVELLAEADGGRMDEVAEAAASVAAYLLDAGFAVGLTVPGDRIDPGAGSDHRTELLTALARAGPGSVNETRRERADVLVEGPTAEEAVTVTVGDRTVRFDQLAGSGSGSGAGTGDGEATGDGDAIGDDTADPASTPVADGGARRPDASPDERGPAAGRDRPAPRDSGGDRQ